MTEWIALAVGMLIGLALGLWIRRRPISSDAPPAARVAPTNTITSAVPTLIGESPPIRGVTAELSSQPLMIGRDADLATFCITDVDGIVSRTHCEVDWDAQSRSFVITDVGSKNGTKIEGIVTCQPGVPTFAEPGATVLVGASSIRVRMQMGSE